MAITAGLSTEDPGERRAAGPAIGTNFHLSEPAVLESVLPHVEVLEITPDALADSAGKRLSPEAVAELASLSAGMRFVAHGVGLSIASHDGWWNEYVGYLDNVMDVVTLEWHSEHLGYTRVNGEFLGTMLPAPRTREMLAVLVGRVRQLQERYGLTFLLENVVGLLPDYPGEFTDAQFLNELVATTGCGLLLDVYNLRCDEANRAFEIAPFLDELDLGAVVEMHVAGGTTHRGFTLDVHSRRPEAATLDLATEVAARCPNLRLVVYELLDEAVGPLGVDAIVDSLVATRRAVTGEPATVHVERHGSTT
jgi:uncharacterized protein (UPF0276 family)